MLRKLFVFVVCLMAATATASAQCPTDEIWYTTTDGRTISFNDDDLVSHNYNNGRGVLKFRDRVTSIGNSAFSCRSSLKSITIPNSVTSIGSWVFEGCSSLKSFNGKYASSDGRCLVIDGELIAFAPAGLTSYTIPNSVTSIDSHAFWGCSSLTSITIPNSVTSIGEGAFWGCSSLKSITIPNSVTSIEYAAFRGCSSLKSVKVANKYCYDYFKDNVANIAFYGANASADGRCLIIDGELKIFIAKGITEYTIPNSVTSIGYEAFYKCSSLTSITIPNSVTRIGESAFQDCSSLKSITIPNSVTSIGWYAFSGCSSLTSITIPNSVKSIGEYAFAYCSSLKSITIPNSVTSIGYGAFYGCSSLKSITIPNSITSIGDYAFYGCDALKDVNVNITNLAKYCKGNAIYKIPGNKHLYINNKEITELVIPNSVTSIGVCAFLGCSSLTSIAIPNSVKSIGEYAFAYCSSLTSIKCLATTPPAIDDLRIAETTMIYVPKEAVKAYKKDLNWSIYKKQIKAIK